MIQYDNIAVWWLMFYHSVQLYAEAFILIISLGTIDLKHLDVRAVGDFNHAPSSLYMVIVLGWQQQNKKNYKSRLCLKMVFY